jgi:hypothetical protein
MVLPEDGLTEIKLQPRAPDEQLGGKVNGDTHHFADD